ncbi:protein kinase 4-like, partial [Diaphorina citri]|uniref:Protein kinase 4-like n=1 Tax=Diaphorina citri TaxID=121845 RepID=A0A1S4EQH3_DIACI
MPVLVSEGPRTFEVLSHTKEYPEFKPIDTSLNLPVLQKYKYNMNHNNDQMDSQYSTLGTPLQSVNYQNVNQGTPPSYTDVVYQNVAQKPKTQSEIIDEHLRQLYSKNTHNAVEIVKSESYSYQVPESSTPLSFYYVQNQSDSSSQHLNPWPSFSHLRDSDVGFSQSHEVFTPSNQDSELYRLQLEYRILENLMKNIEEKKVKSNQTAPDHDEKFVKNPNFNTIPVNKFSPDESLFTREPFHEENIKPHSKELGKVNNTNFNNNVLNSQIQGQSEAVYANPNSWANMNNMNNYTEFLANVIKDSYATNKSNYEDTSNKQNFGVFTMKQNQLLNEAFKHNLLHEEHMRTLLKQNQILKAKLRLAQEKMKRPHHHTKEYPEFKPIDTSLNLPVLQKDRYNMNHNNDQMNSQYSTLGTPLQSVNYQNVNQGTPPSYTDVVYQNVAQKPKTQSEIIDEHLRQLYSKNTHNAVEIVKSEGYSYQ